VRSYKDAPIKAFLNASDCPKLRYADDSGLITDFSLPKMILPVFTTIVGTIFPLISAEEKIQQYWEA
jgi:hypothetical protein